MQAKAVGVTVVWTGVVAFVAFKIVDLMVGLRVTEEEEREGLDISVARRGGLPHVRSHSAEQKGRFGALFFMPAELFEQCNQLRRARPA